MSDNPANEENGSSLPPFKPKGGLLGLMGLSDEKSMEAKWQEQQANQHIMNALRLDLDDEDSEEEDPDEASDVASVSSTSSDGRTAGRGGLPPMKGPNLMLGLDMTSSFAGNSTRPMKMGGTRRSDLMAGSFDISNNGTLALGSYRIRKSGVNAHSAIPVLNQNDLVFERSLGAGASGQVGRYKHVPTGLTVALKVVDVSDKGKREQLIKELRELTDGNCEHVVRYYNSYFADGLLHIALEYMDRGSIESVVQSHGPLSEVVIRDIARQMLLAFIHLHSNKKVHRDIKPGNVLVNQHGEVKIADFGISSRLSNDDEFCRTFVGTQLYMSPERIDSQAYSYPGDIWSFGLTLMYCALGRTPISSEGGYWGIASRLKTEAPPALGPEFSPEIRDFVAKCLIKDPVQRATALQLIGHPFVQGARGPKATIPFWPAAMEMKAKVNPLVAGMDGTMSGSLLGTISRRDLTATGRLQLRSLREATIESRGGGVNAGVAASTGNASGSLANPTGSGLSHLGGPSSSSSSSSAEPSSASSWPPPSMSTTMSGVKPLVAGVPTSSTTASSLAAPTSGTTTTTTTTTTTSTSSTNDPSALTTQEDSNSNGIDPSTSRAFLFAGVKAGSPTHSQTSSVSSISSNPKSIAAPSIAGSSNLASPYPPGSVRARPGALASVTLRSPIDTSALSTSGVASNGIAGSSGGSSGSGGSGGGSVPSRHGTYPTWSPSTTPASPEVVSTPPPSTSVTSSPGPSSRSLLARSAAGMSESSTPSRNTLKPTVVPTTRSTSPTPVPSRQLKDARTERLRARERLTSGGPVGGSAAGSLPQGGINASNGNNTNPGANGGQGNSFRDIFEEELEKVHRR